MTKKLPVSKELAKTISNDFNNNMESTKVAMYSNDLYNVMGFMLGVEAYANRFTWDEIVKLMIALEDIISFDSEDCAVGFAKEFKKLTKPEGFSSFIRSKQIDKETEELLKQVIEVHCINNTNGYTLASVLMTAIYYGITGYEEDCKDYVESRIKLRIY